MSATLHRRHAQPEGIPAQPQVGPASRAPSDHQRSIAKLLLRTQRRCTELWTHSVNLLGLVMCATPGPAAVLAVHELPALPPPSPAHGAPYGAAALCCHAQGPAHIGVPGFLRRLLLTSPLNCRWVGGLYSNIIAAGVALVALACGFWRLGGLIFLIQASTRPWRRACRCRCTS